MNINCTNNCKNQYEGKCTFKVINQIQCAVYSEDVDCPYYVQKK